MKAYANKVRQEKKKPVPEHDAPHEKSDGKAGFQLADNRPGNILQRKLQEMADNSLQTKKAAQLQAMADKYNSPALQPVQKKQTKAGLRDKLESGIETLAGFSMNNPVVQETAEPIQRVLDESDLEAIINDIGDDDQLSNIVKELFTIYFEYKDTINYGTSSQGGAVGFNDYAPFITIIKDKNFWEEDKIKRRSTILHELTHLAQVKSKKGKLNLAPKDEIEGYEEMQPGEKFVEETVKMTEWMTPDINYTDEIGNWIGSMKDLDIPQKEKEYIRERLRYCLTKPHEQPTVLVDVYYYMKAMGLTNNELYEKIKLGAATFYHARRGYTPI